MADRGRRSGNLTDSFIASSDVVYDLFCEVCAEDDKHVEATGFCVECRDYLCQDCVKAHDKSRPSRNHVVQTKSQMPGQKPPPPPPPRTKPAEYSRTERCERHPKRRVEYYCTDDSSFCCSICLVNHRQCQNVEHISDLSENLTDSEDYQEFSDSLTNLKTKSETVIEQAKESILQVDKHCSNVVIALQDLRRKTMDAFDKLEDEIRRKAETIKSADVKKIKTIMDKGIDVLHEVEEISAELHTLESNNQSDQLFIRMMKLEGRVQALYTILDEADVIDCITAYRFEPGPMTQDILADPSSIGQLSVQSFQKSISSSQSVHALEKISDGQATIPTPQTATEPSHMRAVHTSDIRVRTQSDASDCKIIGSVLLPNGNIAIIDYENFKIKLLNVPTLKVTSELKTSSEPWNITHVTDNQLVTTLCNEKKIVFVNATQQLKLEREMKVDGKCTGIQYNNGKLFVAFLEPVKIEIMTLNATVERKIECKDLFVRPIRMALDPGRGIIYVSDDDGDCVKALNLSGDVKAEYRGKKLLYPKDVILDQQGNVLVCGSRSHNIHLLTPDLTQVKVLVEELSCPSSLSLCHATGRLFVGRLDNAVRVFQLS